MLKEIPSTRQRGGELRRRWFTDQRMDLTVWEDEDGQLIAFQLAYDKSRGEHALEWRRGHGFRHHRVDDGESEAGRYKQTPLLLPDGAIPRQRLLREFGKRGQALDAGLRDAVLAALETLAD